MLFLCKCWFSQFLVIATTVIQRSYIIGYEEASTWPVVAQALAVVLVHKIWYPVCSASFGVDFNHHILNSCNRSRDDAPGEQSSVSITLYKAVASPVTMVTWHFMLTESTGFRFCTTVWLTYTLHLKTGLLVAKSVFFITSERYLMFVAVTHVLISYWSHLCPHV